MNNSTTLLIFMGADNNLDSNAMENLNSIRKASLYRSMDIVVQIDRWRFVDKKESFRYHFKNGKEDIVELGELNSGDPNILKAFIEESAKQYPSDRVIVIIWSHGTGIDDRDLYNKNPTRERLFVKNQEIEEIAVSFDDTSKDFIDNIELKKALETNVNIDILGFDACLMGMFEIAYQLRENIDIIVASQYIEPPSGWNYEDILENIKLEDKSTTMADKIVKYYIDKYEQSMSEVTQSALNTKNIETIAKLIDKFILSNGTSGWNMQDANGVSIYFPTRKSPFKETFEPYEKLDFSINYPNWVELIRWYYKNI